MDGGIGRSACGRFVIVRDRDGVRHAIARGAISVMREDQDGGTLLLLTGGRMLVMADGLEATLEQIR